MCIFNGPGATGEDHAVELGLCTNQADLASVAAAGYDYLERATAMGLKVGAAESEWAPVRAAILAAALPTPVCNLFFPNDLKLVGPQRDLARTLDYVDQALTRIVEIGAAIQVFGSGRARTVPEGYPPQKALDELAELCAAIAPLAERRGVIVAMEHLRPAECNLLTTLAETADFVRRVNHPAVRLLADGYHMAQVNEPYTVIRSCADLLVHVHLADPATRNEPSFAGSDLRPLFRELKAAGYDGRLSLECAWKDMPNTLAATHDLVVAQWAES